MDDFKEMAFSPKNWMFVTILPNNSVKVFQVVQGRDRASCLNPIRKALKDAGESVPMTASAEDLITLIGKKFSKQTGIYNNAVVGDWMVDYRDLFKKVDNTKEALRVIAETLKMPVDSTWNTQTFGKKVVEALKKK